MSDNEAELKIGDLIEFNYLFSNEKNKIGIVLEIKKDLNFCYMITILSNNLLEKIPWGILESKVHKL
jgi:hypothetical protein